MTATDPTPEQQRSGPGRPPIGPPVNVRLGDLLPAVDTWAVAHNVKRAEAVRRLVELGLLVNDAGVEFE